METNEEDKFRYARECLEEALKEKSFLSWCGNGSCDIIEYLLHINKDQRKQILDCFADNALLHKRLKKCQEIIKEFKNAEVLDFDTPTWIIRKGFKEGEKRG